MQHQYNAIPGDQPSAQRTQVQAELDNPIDPSSSSFSTRVLIGRRDDEMLEVYARTLMELIASTAPTTGPLLLGINIREHSQEAFRLVMRLIDEHRVW